MRIHTGIRMLFAAALVAAPLHAAVAQDDAKKESKPAPAAAADAKPEPKLAPAADAKPAKPAEKSSAKLETDDDKFSYIMGVDQGVRLRQSGIPYIKERFSLGLNDVLQGKEPALTQEEIKACVANYQQQMEAQQPTPEKPPVITGDDAFKGQLSYLFGVDVGSQLRGRGIDIKTEPFICAMEDSLNERELAMKEEEMQTVFEAYKAKIMEKQKEVMAKVEAERKVVGEKNVAEGKTFLAENAKKPGIKTTASGLQYLVVTPGNGATPKATDTVKTHYRGTLINGTEFDSSYARNEPAEFPVNRVIPGWTEALQLMKVGDKWKLFIPSDLAYAEKGAAPDIGPHAVLVFDIELLEILKADDSDGSIKLDSGVVESKPN